MAGNKTTRNDRSVQEFLESIADERKRKDAFAILKLMKRATKKKPAMWGDSIVGFGTYHYKYASGREGDWPLAGFSPRKQNLTIYIMTGFDRFAAILNKLGKFKTGKSCLYINRLDDVDLKVLEDLIKRSAEAMAKSTG